MEPPHQRCACMMTVIMQLQYEGFVCDIHLWVFLIYFFHWHGHIWLCYKMSVAHSVCVSVCVCVVSASVWVSSESSSRTAQALSCGSGVSCSLSCCVHCPSLIKRPAFQSPRVDLAVTARGFEGSSGCSCRLVWSVALSFILPDNHRLRINWQAASVSYGYRLHVGAPGLVSLDKPLLRCVCRCRCRPVGPNPEDAKC